MTDAHAIAIIAAVLRAADTVAATTFEATRQDFQRDWHSPPDSDLVEQAAELLASAKAVAALDEPLEAAPS